MENDRPAPANPAPPSPPLLRLVYDGAINFAFQQNAIPVVKELIFINDATPRRNLSVRLATEPAFAEPVEFRLESLAAGAEFRASPVDLKLSPDYLAGLREKVTGWLKIEVDEDGRSLTTQKEPVALLAPNEWCGLVCLPEILAAFILPNDPVITGILGRASDLLREHTGRAALNGYGDKSRIRAWEQVAAIYKAVAELGLRYIVPPASFESTGQKVRGPGEILTGRLATCLDLALLFAASCEQAGLHPLVLVHEGHAYAGCWLEERTLAEAAGDDLQQIRKLATEDLIIVWETTAVTHEVPGTLKDAELLAQAHLTTERPFRLALDVRRARLARIHPLPSPAGPGAAPAGATASAAPPPAGEAGLGRRDLRAEPVVGPKTTAPAATRIDQWKSRLLDLSLRNRLLNFKETRAAIRILCAEPERVEDALAAERVLFLRPRPKALGEEDPRTAETYLLQQRLDGLAEHLAGELEQGRLYTPLPEAEHVARVTELYRAARNAIEENGANTLFAAVGLLEWREAEHSDRVLRAPLLLVPVQLKRKSVLEGFTLRRYDEEARVNITLLEMLRQHFQKEIAGLDPLPEDASGVDVGRVLGIFRDAVRDLPGWEVKPEVWLAQFSFTKFLLWKDLADRLDLLTRNRVVRHLVQAEGAQFPNPAADVVPEQLDRDYHPGEIFCPRSADSSQLAAVLAAAAGHDFVLEGPPGTGKSQTITNIIAHCLAHGKRVLFVAEKRAALEVVFRRLREEGLEPFCLELHSNKTGNADVVAQLAGSLKLAAAAPVDEWSERAAELGRRRDALNAYAETLHRRRPCGLSAHDCLDHLLPRQTEACVPLPEWVDVAATPAARLEAGRELAHRLQQRSLPLLPLAGHPLTWLGAEEWSPQWAERTAGQWREFADRTRAAAESGAEVAAALELPARARPLAEWSALGALTRCLPAPAPVGEAFALRSYGELGADLERWIAWVEERAALRHELAACQPAPSGPPGSLMETWSPGEIETVLTAGRGLLPRLRLAAEAVRDWQAEIQFPRPGATHADLERWDALVAALLTPHPVGAEFARTVWGDWVADLDRWLKLVQERAGLRAGLTGYDETRLPALDLDGLADAWQTATGTWWLPRWWGTTTVRRRLQSARPDRRRPEAADVVTTLQAARRLLVINTELRGAGGKAEPWLGEVWQGGEPDPAGLAAVRAWGAGLHAALAALEAADPAWRPALREWLAEWLQPGPAASAPETTRGSRLRRYHTTRTELAAAYAPFAAAAGWDRARLDHAPDHLAAIQEAVTGLLRGVPRVALLNAELRAAAPAARAVLGAVWAHGEPTAAALAGVRDWGRELHAQMAACAGADPAVLARLRRRIAGLLAAGPAAGGEATPLGRQLRRHEARWGECAATLEQLTTGAALRRELLAAAPDFPAAVQTGVPATLGAWRQIREWCAWQKVRAEARAAGLAPLIAAREAAGGENVDLPALFERSFRRALWLALVEGEPGLRDFLGAEHAERIAGFRRADEKIARLTRDLIRSRLAAALPADTVSPAEAGPKTELGLLRKEIAKKRRHLPVRQLLGRLPNLLPRLKPCLLMSPLSVAQYLDPAHAIFDVVIFDEASQIPVWDAVGAIARGQQVIVVGDPKQLPPTNFFATAEDDEESRAPGEIQDLESILDELISNGLRCKRLRWHYRSRHEGLITFSNRRYYDNDLLTFPSVEPALGGVQFRPLPKARYDKGKSRTNPGEARALVAELVDRLRNPGSAAFSYGIVTFSLAQQQLVEDLLDEARRTHPEIEPHFGDEPPVEGEPVFVKNLENVQGDERDVIFFSICYGPDDAGRVSMNFGPLNREGGERRLNVAITRAKHELVVFSGLRAEQIDLTRTRARGVRDLKHFLDYAERGPVALPAAAEASAQSTHESEFERLVAARLRAAGFAVHHQVGCSGYRIDLGILDPAAPGRYLLGVECDGATYHRAATARDRDKLRQGILEDLGWELYRIWSTDWWHDTEAEMGKLLAHLASLRSAAGNAVQAEVKAAKRGA